MPAEFFAMLRNNETRHISLRQDIQQTLSDQFETAAQRFRNPDVELIPLSNAIYSPEIGEEAWAIPGFELPSTVQDAANEVRTLPALTRAELNGEQIKAIGAKFTARRNESYIAFQAVDRRQVVRPEGLTVILDRGVFRRLEEPGLQIGRDVHAVFSQDGLIFDQLFWVKRIFDITAHYREATDADVHRFVQHEEVELTDPAAFETQADEWTRKRVAFILDTEVLDNVRPRQIREKAAEYGISIDISRRSGREKVRFPASKRELKEVLKFLSEDIYKGPLTETQYVSSSKRRR